MFPINIFISVEYFASLQDQDWAKARVTVKLPINKEEREANETQPNRLLDLLCQDGEKVADQELTCNWGSAIEGLRQCSLLFEETSWEALNEKIQAEIDIWYATLQDAIRTNLQRRAKKPQNEVRTLELWRFHN